MAKLVPIFKGTSGINNKTDPVRLAYNPETGIQDLAAGVNVDIDRTGRISRRKGCKLVLQKSAHSLFPCRNYCLFVSSDALCVLEPDYSWAAIRNITIGARMSYVQVGNSIYYANGYEKGIVKDKLSYSWFAASYVGPTTTKVFSSPPIGHLLELFNGVMLVAEDDILWYSEPFAYSWFDLTRNYIQFSDRLTMVKVVQEGIFVSTENETRFYKGTNVKELQEVKLTNYPAIEGTAATVDIAEIGDGSRSGLGVMWASTKGICFGGPDGSFKNFTQDRLDYPAARYGAGLSKGGKYICLLKP